MKNKKSQAAMEFLMTYGWAILVVLIVIGALAYFGVLDPFKFVPEDKQKEYCREHPDKKECKELNLNWKVQEKCVEWENEWINVEGLCIKKKDERKNI